MILIALTTNGIYADTIPDNSSIFGIWAKENSPYIIMGEVSVPVDSTLIIEPGVIVQLKSSTYDSSFYYSTLGVGLMKVYGKIVAIGTENDSIVFTRNGFGYWGSISFLHFTEEPNVFKFCKVSYGKSIYDDPGGPNNYIGGIAIHGTNAILENSLFEYNPNGISTSYSNIVTKNCCMRYNGTGISNFNSISYIENNIVFDNQNEGISSHTSISLIASNLIEDNLQGIHSYESLDTISNNIIKNNLWGGIEITRNNSFVNNNIIYGSNSGIRCNGQPRIINNTIVNNNYFGIYCDWEAKPIIVNSIIFGNQHLMLYHSNDSIVIVNSLVQVDSFPEVVVYSNENIFNQDPCFVDTLNENFGLLENSPCINKGIPFFAWNNDTILNLSSDYYIGSAPDIGAIESPYVVAISENRILESKILSQNYPNPFNRSTNIKIRLLNNKQAKLSIYNLSGILVKSFIINGKGNHSIFWDGIDNNGNYVKTGVYYYHLDCNQGRYINKMIFAK